MTSTICEAKKQYYNRKITNVSDDPRKLWKIINTLIYNQENTKSNDTIPTKIIKDNNEYTGTKDILNLLTLQMCAKE